MDKFKKIIYCNKKIIVFLISLSIIALIFGSCLPIFLSAEDKQISSEYMLNFLNEIKTNYNNLFLLKNSLINNCGFSFLIWLLGISIIGIPIIIFLFFSKCFILGFTITSIIINFGFKGILFALSYIFPHNIINILVFSVITCYSLIFSLKLILFIFKKHEFNIRVGFNKYFKIFCFCVLIIIVCCLYESFINPYVMRFIIDLIKI